MKKIFLQCKLWAFMLMATAFAFNANAAIWEIPNSTTDSLDKFMDAIDKWAPGDTIMLTSSSTYIANGTMDFFQSAVVMGDPSLDFKPTIKFEDNGFRAKADSIDITISGLKLDGYKTDGSRANHALRFDQAYDTTWWGDVLIQDCEIWGFKGIVQLYKNKGGVYESFTMDDCIANDIQGDYAIDPKINAVKEFYITNSTFTEISHGFITNLYFQKADEGRTITIPQSVVIDHNTFYKVTGDGNKSLIQMNDGADESITLAFTNNIVQTLWEGMEPWARPFRINEFAGDFDFQYSTFYNFHSTYQESAHNLDSVAKNQANVNTYEIYRENPAFADTLTADFSLPGNSPLLTAASDGGAIGDPRWVPAVLPYVPGAHVHMIPNAATDTLDKFMDAIDKWAAGDTIMLTSSSTYIANGTMDFFQSAVVMGDPRLDIKPTIKFEDNGFRAKADSVDISIVGLKLDGYKTDGSRANHALRFDQAYDTNWWGDVLIQDCEIWGFKGIVQLYKNKGGLYESFTMDDCIVYDIQEDYAIDPKINAVRELKITNSTFTEISHGFLTNLYFANPDDGRKDTIAQAVLIDHNTFYKVTGNGNKSLVQMNDGSDSSVTFTFTNNIVQTLWEGMEPWARPFRINESAGEFNFEYSLFYNFYSSYQNGVHNLDTLVKKQTNVDTNYIYKFNPLFADTLDANFMISDASPLMSAGSDGGPIGDPRWIPVAGVTVNPLTSVFVEGDSIQLTAEANVSGEDKTVSWSVENGTGEATINAETGWLKAVSPGTVTVTATSNYSSAISGELNVTIAEKTYVTGIDLSAANASGIPTTTIANKGGYLIITAVINPGDASDKSLAWSWNSEDGGNATIAEEGPTTARLTAIQCGTITVTATATDGSEIDQTIDIDVTGQTTATAVTVTATDDITDLMVGQTVQMIATVEPDTVCDETVTWAITSGDQYATITVDGILEATAADGEVTVRARANDGSYKSGTYVISTKPSSINNIAYEALTVMPNPASAEISFNNTQTIEVVITNIVGATVMNEMVDADASIDISVLNNGMYIANIKSGNQVKTIRFVVK